MAIITIDTEKDSKEHIAHTIEFLQRIVGTQDNISVTTSTSNSDFFGNSLPSSGPQVTQSANDLLNMCDDENDYDEEEEKDEIKPSAGLTDFSQFMPN